MKCKKISTLIAALALTASAGAVSAADDTAASTQAQPDAAAPAQAQARRAVRDKETGKLRAPTQEELKVMLEDERAARRARGQPEPSAAPTPIVVRQHPQRHAQRRSRTGLPGNDPSAASHGRQGGNLAHRSRPRPSNRQIAASDGVRSP